MKDVQNFLDCCEDSCEVSKESALFSWSLKGVGFGQLYFYKGDDDKTHCHNETMSKATIKKILYNLVDECVLDDK